MGVEPTTKDYEPFMIPFHHLDILVAHYDTHQGWMRGGCYGQLCLILGTFKPHFGGSSFELVVAQAFQLAPFIQHFKSEVTALSGTLAQTILLVA